MVCDRRGGGRGTGGVEGERGGPDSQLRSGDETKETAGGGEHVQGWMDAEMEGISLLPR